MKSNRVMESWGRYPKATQSAVDLSWMTDAPGCFPAEGTVLPYGKGRSYGDVCLNDGGTLIVTGRMNHFISFDIETGVLRCEAGVGLDEILSHVVHRGWFLPVTPGTKFITVGGAVANDVHGKNHHLMGTFGEHVRAFELLRSDGQRLVCTPTQNREMFFATIGGMGLTGLMLWVEFQLKRVHGPFIAVEHVKYRTLDDFFRLAAESEAKFEYTVAWVDCLASGAKLGRGIFMRGNDATAEQTAAAKPVKEKRMRRIPCDAPGFLLNRASVWAFNNAFYAKQLHERSASISHYEPFFYPLDSLHDWNRLYGRRGFFQYQFVVPPQVARSAIEKILGRIAKSGMASFLAVMKNFGDRRQAGMMSFPRKGLTLAMDLPNVGGDALKLMDELDDIVLESGGILYPAKDARMAADKFKTFYPQWKEFAKFIDPKFSSSFWRRVTG
jgi:FAD/FMN-containing dehydrogenase